MQLSPREQSLVASIVLVASFSKRIVQRVCVLCNDAPEAWITRAGLPFVFRGVGRMNGQLILFCVLWGEPIDWFASVLLASFWTDVWLNWDRIRDFSIILWTTENNDFILVERLLFDFIQFCYFLMLKSSTKCGRVSVKSCCVDAEVHLLHNELWWVFMGHHTLSCETFL